MHRGSRDAKLFLENVAATSFRYWQGEAQPPAAVIPQFDFGGQDVGTAIKPRTKRFEGIERWRESVILGMKTKRMAPW